MTRQASKHNQPTVPVLDKDSVPVSPTRPSRARRMVKSRYFHPDPRLVIATATLVNGKQRVTVARPGSVQAARATLLRKANGYRYKTTVHEKTETTK